MDILDVASPTVDGHWISDRVSRIVEIINDLDPNIKVKWIPADVRGPNEPAFALFECAPNRPEYIMFYVNTEAEFDERVIERILSIDGVRNPLSLESIDKKNAAVKLVQLKKQMEELEASHELAASIYKSPKTRYKHDGVTYE